MLFLAAKTIAHAEHGFDVARLAGVGFDFGAQVANMHIHRALDAFKRNALQFFEQGGARKNMTRRGHQGREQFKFGGRKFDRRLVDLDRVFAFVERDVGGA